MQSYTYIVVKLVRALGELPPETATAMLLAAPEVLATLAGLPWILNLIIGEGVIWYLKSMLEAHLWPELPPNHQRLLLQLRERILLRTPRQHGGSKQESRYK